MKDSLNILSSPCSHCKNSGSWNMSRDVWLLHQGVMMSAVLFLYFHSVALW